MNVLVVFIILMAILFQSQEDTQEDFELLFKKLYGEEVKKVSSNLDLEDDIALAKRLLEDLVSLTDSQPFQEFLCEKAWFLSSNSEQGYSVALEAMRHLGVVAPKRAIEAKEKILGIYKIQYRTAKKKEKAQAGRLYVEQLMVLVDLNLEDGNTTQALAHCREAEKLPLPIKKSCGRDIPSLRKSLEVQYKLEKEVAEMNKALEKNPSNISLAIERSIEARKLVMLYIIEQDNPQKALSLLEVAEADELLQKNIRWAAKNIVDLSKEACLELGNWYKSLADQDRDWVKTSMLQRANTYYESFLQKHTKRDAKTLEVTQSKEKVSHELKRIDFKAKFLPKIKVKSVKTVNIKPLSTLQTTKYRLKVGHYYEIAAKGLWAGSDGMECGPSGAVPDEFKDCMGPPPGHRQCFLGQHPKSALIGSIEGQDWIFLVGEEIRLLAPASGILYLGINDLDQSSDNRHGALEVTLSELVDCPWKFHQQAFSVKARIDALDFLHITPKGIFWEYGGQWTRVGYHQGYYPTEINGVYWWPEWPDNQRSSLLLCKYFFPPKGKSLVIQNVNALRGSCVIERLEEKEIVLGFNDAGINSSSIEIVYVFK